MPILDKIKDYIRDTDIIICRLFIQKPKCILRTWYDSYGQKVILITEDEVKDTPTDIRHFEFIQYSLGKHVEFFGLLDNALHSVSLIAMKIFMIPRRTYS